MKRKVNTLIVEDHDFASQGIIDVLKKHEKFDFFIEEARHADEALHKMQRTNFNLILLDLVLKNDDADAVFSGGDDLLRYVKNNAAQFKKNIEDEIKVIVLSKVDSVEMLDYIINVLGADGYILKSDKSIMEVLKAIEIVFNGKQYISSSLERQFKYYESILDLDYRDKVILNELSQGGSHKDIVGSLKVKGITITTSAVEKRIRTLKERFHAKTTNELMVKAIQMGIISY